MPKKMLKESSILAEAAKPKYTTEFFFIDSIESKVDSAGKEYTTFRALAQQIDVKNGNKRIYTNDAIDEAVAIIRKQIEKKAVFALIDHPDAFERVKIKNAGARITDVEIQGQNIYVTGVFIQNDAYLKHLKPLIDSGSQVGLSVRGYTINSNNPEWNEGKDAWIYKKGYRIDGWDFVLNPAVEEASIISLEDKEIQANDNKEEKVMDFKTYSELKAHFPHLFVEDDAARKAAIDSLQNEKSELEAKLKTATDSLSANVAKMAEKDKENETLSAKLKTTEASLDSLKNELDGIKFQGELSKLMTDCKYKEHIVVPAHIKNIADAKTYIDGEVARLDTFLAKIRPAAEKIVDGKPATPAESQTPATSVAMDEQDTWIMLGSDKNLIGAKK